MIQRVALGAALTIVLALGGIATMGATPRGEAASMSVVVQPLTRQQQAAIDSGTSQSQTPRVRPATYTYGTGDPHQHCIAQVAPLQVGQAPPPVSNFQCFATFSQALAAATGGKVQTAPDFRPDDLTQAMLSSPATDTVLGVDYWDSNFSGSTYTWYTTHTAGCTDGSSYGGNLPSSWNDQISSARGYAGCNDMIHYENSNYGGSSRDCHQDWTSCATMGVMNDQTSSVNLRP